jgi:hypothetical protein
LAAHSYFAPEIIEPLAKNNEVTMKNSAHAQYPRRKDTVIRKGLSFLSRKAAVATSCRRRPAPQTPGYDGTATGDLCENLPAKEIRAAFKKNQ